ncbi:MAG: DUF58 domain-containing protein [Steroidobacteraceae bacterium]|nr:DUF58 domain-containing protein [Steroidobacteraceae bacterium]MDW8260527.1 DUF58 domain-containing protein [Gammaproteobacteria bacterium]
MHALSRRLRTRLATRFARWIRARQGEDRLPLTLRRNRLYILPTRAGLGFTALVVMMLLAGLNYGNSLALLLGFWLIGFLFVALVITHRNLQGLQLASATLSPAFAGDAARLSLQLTAPQRRRYALQLSLPSATARLDAVDCGGSARLECALPTVRRGRYPLERIGLQSTFPFGLFRAWTWLHLPFELIVYPVPRGVRALPASAEEADQGSAPLGAGHDEWSGLRPFRDGDSPRRVVWTAYARELPLFVKEYSGASAESLLLDFDRLGGLDTERRLEQLARWVIDAERRGARYALRLPGVRLDADSGPAHRRRALHELAVFGCAESGR